MSRWIFLRGLTREARHWGEFPEIFRQHLPDAEILTPDLPGNGLRADESSPRSITTMVASIRSTLTGDGRPASLLALSLGAMVATAWAREHPDEVAACVLINTSLRPFSPPHQRLRPASYGRLLDLLVHAGDAERAERSILELTSCRHAADATLLAHWVAIRRHRPVIRSNAINQLLAALRYRAPSAPPPVPTLLLASAGDRLVAPRCSERLAAAWQVPLCMHPDAGHDLPLDDPHWVASEVAAWWRTWK